MPKEYSQSDSSASSPNPSQFGSSEIRLDTPQFTAQTAVEQKQNPFDMLQGILQSAVGVVSQSNKNKEAAIQGKMALAQAQYVSQQRAYAEEARIKGDANEATSNEITRDQTTLDKMYAGGLFDLAEVQVGIFETSATSDRKKAWAAKERLQMDAHKRAYEARLEGDSSKRSTAERGLLFSALAGVDKNGLEVNILTRDAIAFNKTTFLDGVAAENLQAAVKDRLMNITVDPFTGERQIGLPNWDLLSEDSRKAVEAKVVSQIDSSLSLIMQQRTEVALRAETAVLQGTVSNVSNTMRDGTLSFWTETRASVQEAFDGGKISPATYATFNKSLIDDLARSYKTDGGYAGAVAAMSEIKGMEATQEISGAEANRAVTIIGKRAEAEVKNAISLIEGRSLAVTPENDQHTLANIPDGKLASQAAMEAMGVTEETLLKFPEGVELLRDFDARQARDITAVKRIADQQSRADDVETILGLGFRSQHSVVNNIPGTEGYEAEKAYLKKGMDDETLSTGVRSAYASALISLTRDNRAFLEQKRVAGQKAFDSFEDASVNSVKTLVNDAFTASFKEETPEGRAKVFGEAITAISVLRETAVDGSTNEKALSLAERQLQAAKSSSLTTTTTTTQTRFGLTDAQNLWQATTRQAKNFPPGSPEYNAVMGTGLDSMIRMGTFFPAAVKHLESMATQGGNDLTTARDFILKSGALRGEPAIADMFFDQAPNLTRAVLLTKAQEQVAGKVLGEETLQANLKTIVERDAKNRSSSAFVTTGKEEGASDTAAAPLKFQAELQAAMDGVYGISGLDMNGFTYNADDQQVFNTFFTEGLHSNLGANGVGNPAAAIVYAVNAMQMVGYSPRYNGGKVDFVYDPHQVVPVIVSTPDESGYLFGQGQNKENFDIVWKSTALAALKEYSQADFGSLNSIEGATIELVMDSNYMGSPEGGVPFNITLGTGRVILYTEFPAGRVPLIRRKDIDNYRKRQGTLPPLSKTLQEGL